MQTQKEENRKRKTKNEKKENKKKKTDTENRIRNRQAYQWIVVQIDLRVESSIRKRFRGDE